MRIQCKIKGISCVLSLSQELLVERGHSLVRNESEKGKEKVWNKVELSGYWIR